MNHVQEVMVKRHVYGNLRVNEESVDGFGQPLFNTGLRVIHPLLVRTIALVQRWCGRS